MPTRTTADTAPSKDSAEAYLGIEFMIEKLNNTELLTRFTDSPVLTIPGRHRFNYRFDLDFNMPGDWYLRLGLFDNFDNKPDGFAQNEYAWSEFIRLKF